MSADCESAQADPALVRHYADQRAMRGEINWGPEIAVEGKRPEWLVDGVYRVNHGLVTFDGEQSNSREWRHVTAIRLPADHPHYAASQPRTAPSGGEVGPEVVERMKRVIMRHVACKTTMFDNESGPNLSVEAEFRAIASLVAPDPDLAEARKLAAEVEDAPYGTLEDLALAAIKRGRALATTDSRNGGE